MGFSMGVFENLVRTAVQNKISDIHLRCHERPYFRNRGELIPVKIESLNENDFRMLAQEIFVDEDAKNNYDKVSELDGSYSFKDLCRIRYNFFRFCGRPGMIIRIISNSVPTLESLGVSPLISKIAGTPRGLVLVAGATGSGKSSTMAAMINYINNTRSDHILTIEDPIEFLHTPIKSRITQREIGIDTKDFMVALRSALRQDPDVILIGEMRDAQTMDIALKAAETGHAVYATIHTTNALNTIGRLVAMFPPEEQQNVRARIADNLYAVICQRLVPSIAEGKGMVAAQEIMVTNPGIKECIVGKLPMGQLNTFIENGYKNGESQGFDQHLHELIKKRMIDKETAKNNATSPDNFERDLVFTRG